MVTENKSLVSILIPAYSPAYLKEALESALEQTYSHIEIIVCDDSGDNHVREIVSSLNGRGRIQYHANQRNLGARQNYLKCFGMAKGVYIKYLNDDDVLDRDCVRRMVDVLERFSQVALVCSRRRLIDGKGSDLPDTPFSQPIVGNDSIIPGFLTIRRMLERQINFIGEPTTTMFRRADIEGIRPDIMSFGGRRVLANLDVAMWLNLLCKGDLAYLIDVLSCFRIHSDQEQQKDSVRQLCIAAWRQVIEDALKTGVLALDGQTGKKIRRF